MIKRMLKYGFLFFSLLFFVQFGCSSESPVVAGGGTNVKNAGLIKGRIVTSKGEPVSDATVRLMPADYFLFVENPEGEQDTFTTTTDFNGIYVFRNIKEGEYTIQVFESSENEYFLVRANVFVAGDSLTDVETDTLRESGIIIVHLFEFRPPKGILFIPGTNIYKEIDSTSNSAVFDFVPQGEYSEICFSLRETDVSCETICRDLSVKGGDTLIVHQYNSLVVTGGGDSFLECDSLIVSELNSIGVGTKVVDDDLVCALDTPGIDFILISPSASSQNTEVLKQLPVSVIVSQTALYPVFDMTDDCLGIDYSVYDPENISYTGATLQVRLEMRNSQHPISSGLAGNHIFLDSAEYIVWGIPQEKGLLVASNTINDEQVIIFSYEQGEMMSTFSAPERRIALSYHKDIYPSLNEIGWKLFRGCVRYALGYN